MKPNFKRDLEAGQQGERAFIALAAKHGIILTQTEGRNGDLLGADGAKWEVKTDRYDHAKTGNLFIEYMSDVDAGKWGGPWQAEKNNCQWFVYYFSNPGIAYIFDTNDLLRQMQMFLLTHIPNFVEVRNTRWTTIGYKVPRSLLSPSQVLYSLPKKGNP